MPKLSDSHSVALDLSTFSLCASRGERSEMTTSFFEALTVSVDVTVVGAGDDAADDDDDWIVDNNDPDDDGDGVIDSDDTDEDDDDNSYIFLLDSSTICTSFRFRDLSLSSSTFCCFAPLLQLSMLPVSLPFFSASQRYRLSGSESAAPSGEGARARRQPRGEPTGVVLMVILVALLVVRCGVTLSVVSLLRSQGCVRHWWAVGLCL